MRQEAGPTNPPEIPDMPEVEDIPEEFRRSKCCGLPAVPRTLTGTHICECFKFCEVDIDASIKARNSRPCP